MCGKSYQMKIRIKKFMQIKKLDCEIDFSFVAMHSLVACLREI